VQRRGLGRYLCCKGPSSAVSYGLSGRDELVELLSESSCCFSFTSSRLQGGLSVMHHLHM
jgi:hypothetical protein